MARSVCGPVVVGGVERCSKAKSEVARILQHATHMCGLKRPLLLLVLSLFARLECVKIRRARRSDACCWALD